jgi:hypothetical protein
MIICSCRNIKTTDFKTDEELFERLKEVDRDCCSCIGLFVKEKGKNSNIIKKNS